MPDALQRLHGLEEFLAARPATNKIESAISAEVLPELTYLNLRGNPGNADFLERVQAVLGQALPLEANTMTIGQQNICWLGPDEWLITGPAKKNSGLIDSMLADTTGMHVAINDLSGGLVTIRLTGENTDTLLSKGCTLDFHPTVFAPGGCAQSVLAKANVVIVRAATDDSFDIIVRRSFAEYLALWLERAASDSGIVFR